MPVAVVVGAWVVVIVAIVVGVTIGVWVVVVAGVTVGEVVGAVLFSIVIRLLSCSAVTVGAAAGC